MTKYICGGIGLTSIGLGLQPYIEMLQPYSLWFILGGIFLFVSPLLLKLFNHILKRFFSTKFAEVQLFRKHKDYGILKEHTNPKIKEYILRLTALKNYIMQLQNHSSRFRPKVVKNSNDFWGHIFTLSRNRYDTNISKNDILSKYNNVKTDIEQDYPVIFKDLSKNITYEIAIYEINCLLNTFNSMQKT